MQLEHLIDELAPLAHWRQTRFEQRLRGYQWDLALDFGTVTYTRRGLLGLGVRERVVAEIHLLGIESNAPKTWLWSWAEDPMPSPALIELADELRHLGREQGVKPLAKAFFAIEPHMPRMLALCALGWSGASGIQRCETSHGAMWMLVEDEELDVSIELPALVFVEALTAATEGGLVRDHRRAAVALARSLGIDTRWSDVGTLWVGDGAERVELSFDDERRMTRLDAAPVRKSA